MWVACNNLVHSDGESRQTLIIDDINQQVKRRLLQEGTRQQFLFLRDDRKFFKTPCWKLEKKTEVQKIRYIETNTRLLAEEHRPVLQTLNRWRLDSSL